MLDLGLLLTLYPPPRPLTAPGPTRQSRVSRVSAGAAKVLTCPARDTEPEPQTTTEDPRKKES